MKQLKTTRCTTTTYDRVQALIRNPLYLKDWKELTSQGPKYCLENGSKFAEKYHLTIPFVPEEFKQYPPEALENAALFTDGFVIRTTPVIDDGYLDVIQDDKDDVVIKWKKDPFLKDERYLSLEVDLFQGKETIMAQFKNLIDYHSKYAHKRKTRTTKSRELNKFLAWDEYLSTKSFSKIARKYRKNVSTVRMAYLKAFELIMGEKYNPSKHDREKVEKDQLAVTCDVCKSRKTCTTLCPAVLGYVEQDQVSRREVFVKEPRFSKLDY